MHCNSFHWHYLVGDASTHLGLTEHPELLALTCPECLDEIAKILRQRLVDTSFLPANIKISLGEFLLMGFYSLTKPVVFRPQGQAGKGLMSVLVLEPLVLRASDFSSQSWKNMGQIVWWPFKYHLNPKISRALISNVLRSSRLSPWPQVRPFRFRFLRRIDHRLVAKLPLQQRWISAVPNNSQSPTQCLCYPNVWKNRLVYGLSLSCRGFQGLSEALQELKDESLV